MTEKSLKAIWYELIFPFHIQYADHGHLQSDLSRRISNVDTKTDVTESHLIDLAESIIGINLDGLKRDIFNISTIWTWDKRSLDEVVDGDMSVLGELVHEESKADGQSLFRRVAELRTARDWIRSNGISRDPLKSPVAEELDHLVRSLATQSAQVLREARTVGTSRQRDPDAYRYLEIGNESSGTGQTFELEKATASELQQVVTMWANQATSGYQLGAYTTLGKRGPESEPSGNVDEVVTKRQR